MDPLLRFGVPGRHQRPLLSVVDFDESAWRAILEVLEGAVSDHASAVDRLVEAGLPEREADQFFEAAVSLMLAMWRVDQNPKAVASAATQSLAATDESLSGEQHKTLQGRLGDVLRATELRQFAHAARLTMESDRLYDDAHIISDIRPLFDDGVIKGARAGVIVHALRINTFNRMTNERETVEIGMTATDVADLKKTLNRAAKKDQEIERMFAQLGLRRIDVGRLL